MVEPRAAGATVEPSRAELLGPETVAAYLVERGLVPPDADAQVRTLGGGVSNVVLSVTAGDLRAVVKQALPRLRVEAEWLAKQERAITEGEALRLAAGIDAALVPRLLDLDPHRCALTIELAPETWENWKDQLLAGEADAAVAAAIGRFTGQLHGDTAGGQLPARFDDEEAFRQLRVAPYYEAVAARHPDLGPRIGALAERMLAARRCLVHGDLSPKNVLVGDGRVWLLDFEVAHLGDPVFDLAFMLNHFMLKAVNRPDAVEGYVACADAFVESYAAVARPLLPPEGYLAAHLGVLMLARIDGKSPVEYLGAHAGDLVRPIARALIDGRVATVADAWRRVRERAA